MADPRHEVWHLDRLITRCGYFTSRTTVNNGYGCRHPEQEDVEDEYVAPGAPAPKEAKCGRCLACTCPIAAQFCPRDNPEDKAECAELDLNPVDFDDDHWMLVAVDEHGELVGRRVSFPTPPIDIAREVWFGEWTRHASPGTHEALVLELPDPFTDQPGPCGVRVDADEERGWWVNVCIGGEVVEIHGEDLAATLQLARETTVREFTPLLRALGADLITAALAATE